MLEARSAGTQFAFETVASFMHYTGDQRHRLTDAERYEVYCEADGFGYLSRAELLTVNDGWDWSHVRDSSDEGVMRMLAKLEEVLAR